MRLARILGPVLALLPLPLAAQEGAAACVLAPAPGGDPAFLFPLSRLDGLAAAGCDAASVHRAGEAMAAALDVARLPEAAVLDADRPGRVSDALLSAALELVLAGHPGPFDALVARLVESDDPEAAAALAVLGWDGAGDLDERAARLRSTYDRVAGGDALASRREALAAAAPARAHAAAQGGSVIGLALEVFGRDEIPDPCSPATAIPEEAGRLADALEAGARLALGAASAARRAEAAHWARAAAEMRSGCGFSAGSRTRSFGLDDADGADRAMALAAALPAGPVWPRDLSLAVAVWLDGRGEEDAAARFLLDGLRETVGKPGEYEAWVGAVSRGTVAEAQRLLEAEGLYDAGIDGIAGPGFARGVASLFAAERRGLAASVAGAGLGGLSPAEIRTAPWGGSLAASGLRPGDDATE